MTVYLDADYKCHVADDGTMTAVETDFFDGKSPEFIEGYRLVPEGETWIRDDGHPFNGLMIVPWKDYTQLAKAQSEYELEQLKAELADMKAALELLEVHPDE